MPETEKNNKQPNLITKWRIASLGMEMGFIIAIPLLILALGGKWLDQKYNTTPWLTVFGILLAIAASTFWLTRRIKELIK
jgi:LPXTG-motif cell wall-anchored protein